MSIEALWTIQFADATAPDWLNGGIVVLETGRAFGGDSMYYYLGTYKIEGSTLHAEVRVVHYSGPASTTFGDDATDFIVKLEGERSGDTILGNMHRPGAPELKLPFRMLKRAELP